MGFSHPIIKDWFSDAEQSICAIETHIIITLQDEREQVVAEHCVILGTFLSSVDNNPGNRITYRKSNQCQDGCGQVLQRAQCWKQMSDIAERWRFRLSKLIMWMLNFCLFLGPEFYMDPSQNGCNDFRQQSTYKWWWRLISSHISPFSETRRKRAEAEKSPAPLKIFIRSRPLFTTFPANMGNGLNLYVVVHFINETRATP